MIKQSISKIFLLVLIGVSIHWSALAETNEYLYPYDDNETVYYEPPVDIPFSEPYTPVSLENRGLPLNKLMIPAGIAAIGLTIGAVKALECSGSDQRLQFTGSFQATTGQSSENIGDTTLVFEIIAPDSSVFYSDSLVSGISTGGEAVTFTSGSTTFFRSGDVYTVNVTSLTSTGASTAVTFTVDGLVEGVIFDSQTASPPTSSTTFTFTIP